MLVTTKRTTGNTISASVKYDITNQINEIKVLEMQIKNEFEIQLKQLDSQPRSTETSQQRAMLVKLYKDFERVKAVLSTTINESQQFKVAMSDPSSSANSNRNLNTNTSNIFQFGQSTNNNNSQNKLETQSSQELKLLPLLQGSNIFSYLLL